MYIDEYGNEHTVESLTKRFNAIPDWYWSKRKHQKEAAQNLFKKEMLKPIAEMLEFIEYKIEDWSSDVEAFY